MVCSQERMAVSERRTSCSVAFFAFPRSKNEVHVHRIPQRRPVRLDSRTKPQRPQDFRQATIVPAVTRLIVRDQRRVALLIDVEPRDQMIGLDSGGRRQRRNEEITERRRVILARPSTGARADAAASSCPNARAHTATRTWPLLRRYRRCQHLLRRAVSATDPWARGVLASRLPRRASSALAA